MLPGFIQRAIQDELNYQDDKFGADKQQSLPGYFLLMRRELDEAEAAWAKGPWNGRNSAMAELTQVVTLGIRAMMQYGTDGCPAATNDTYNTSNTFKSAVHESQEQQRETDLHVESQERLRNEHAEYLEIEDFFRKLFAAIDPARPRV